MLNNVIHFAVVVNVALIMLVVCLSTYITIQGQRLKDYQSKTEKMRMEIRWYQKKSSDQQTGEILPGTEVWRRKNDCYFPVASV